VITETVQRWTLGREHRRPAGEVIRASEYDVAPITGAVARAFVETHHYSRTCSPPAHPFGLHHRGALVGAAVFGPPASMNAHRAVFPSLAIDQAVTLGRLVLLDSVPGNGESWFVARCFDLLRAKDIVAVESCADPQPRTTIDGHRVHRGHVGTIYCALNGRHVGRTNAASLHLLPDGSVLSNRAQGKIARRELNNAGPAAQLVRFGADPLPAEAPAEVALTWLRLWRARLTRPMRHRGNFRYVWALSKRYRCEIEKLPRLPYPKIDLIEAAT
jgi:hypothetical protein